MAIIVRRKDRLRMAEATRLIGLGTKQVFEDFGGETASDLRTRLPVSGRGKFPRGVDRGGFKKSIRHRTSGAGFNTKLRIFSGSRHAEFVEFGRDPGKQPPTDKILAWVRRRGIGARAFSVRTRRQIAAGTRRIQERTTGRLRTRAQSLRVIQRGIAFVIARNIGRRGVIGLFLFTDVPKHYRVEIQQMRRRQQLRISQLLNS